MTNLLLVLKKAGIVDILLNLLTKKAVYANVALVLFAFWLVSSHNYCYAASTKTTIKIKCNKDFDFVDGVNLVYYAGDKKVKYSLATIKMEAPVLGDGDITSWDNLKYGTAYIGASCGTSTSLVNMVPSNPHPVIMCQRGQSLRVVMGLPIDPNPNAYVYYGELTVDTEDDGKNQEQEKITLKQEDKQPEKNTAESQVPDDASTVAGDENEPLLSGKQQSGVTDKDKMGILESICSSLGIQCDSNSILKSLKLGAGSGSGDF